MDQRKRVWLPYVVVSVVLFSGIAFAATMKSIQIKTSALRSSPSFMGKIIATVSYGDRVEEVESKNGWANVKPTGTETSGWIHDSALTHKEILLESGNTNVAQSATSNEIALAGKGFNEQVERGFKERNPQLDYAAIDRMEKIVIPDRQMRQFLEEGRIVPREDASQ